MLAISESQFARRASQVFSFSFIVAVLFGEYQSPVVHL